MTSRQYGSTRKPTFGQRVLGAVLSPRTRKLIFLSSLAGYLQKVTNPDNEMVEKINELFSLSRDPTALKLPMQMSARIWSAFDESALLQAGINTPALSELSNSKLSAPQLRIISNQLINTVPCWLIYGSREAMRQDICKLLQTPSEAFHTPSTAVS